jgi:hypothetical protein
MRTNDEEQEQARLERARAIGLFRYMLIREAADPALPSRQRGAMVRDLAGREHAGPGFRTDMARSRAVARTAQPMIAPPPASTRKTAGVQIRLKMAPPRLRFIL